MLFLCPVIFGILLTASIFLFSYLFEFLGLDKSHLNTALLFGSSIATALIFKKRKGRRFNGFEYSVTLVTCSVVNGLFTLVMISMLGMVDKIHGRLGGLLLILIMQSIGIALGLAPFKRIQIPQNQPNPALNPDAASTD